MNAVEICRKPSAGAGGILYCNQAVNLNHGRWYNYQKLSGYRYGGTKS